MEFLNDFDGRFGGIVVADEEEEDGWQSNYEEDNDLLNLELERKYRQFARIDFINMWNDDEFFSRFRMRKPTIVYVLSLIENQLTSNTYRNR